MLSRNKATTKLALSSFRGIGAPRSYVVGSKSRTTTKLVDRVPILTRHHRYGHVALPVSSFIRYKSSAALSEFDDDDEPTISGHTEGHAAAAAARIEMGSSHEEAWMINLGRGADNDWLTGPRDEDWFTGLKPSDCPGKSTF